MYPRAGQADCGPRGTPFLPKHLHTESQFLRRAPGAASARRSTPQRLRPCCASEVTWEQAVNYEQSGTIWEGPIVGVNKGGVLVQFDDLSGFIPYSRLDQSRLEKEHEDRSRKYLMGQSIRAKVIKVDEKDNVLVMSERAVLFDEAMGFLNVGDEVKGVVTGVVDYGAFVDIRLQDGLLHGVAGLVHKSELSWDKVATPDALLKEGTEVTAIVTGIDKDLGRISLSLRQAQQDPLRETLDTLLPISEAPPSGSSYAPGGTSLRGLDTIVDALQAVEGIEAVQLGRQANETHVVSQDLEIWLAKEDVPAGFNVVARAGRQLQEVYITTELSRDQMKEVLESVLARTV